MRLCLLRFFSFFVRVPPPPPAKTKYQNREIPHHRPDDPPQRPEDRGRVQEPERVEPLRVVQLEHVEDALSDAFEVSCRVRAGVWPGRLVA